MTRAIVNNANRFLQALCDLTLGFLSPTQVSATWAARENEGAVEAVCATMNTAREQLLLCTDVHYLSLSGKC